MFLGGLTPCSFILVCRNTILESKRAALSAARFYVLPPPSRLIYEIDCCGRAAVLRVAVYVSKTSVTQLSLSKD